MKSRRAAGSTDMRPEYTFDYSTAVRGKYYRRLLKEGSTRGTPGFGPARPPFESGRAR